MKEILYTFDQTINPIQGKKGMIFSGKKIDSVIVMDSSGKYYFKPAQVGNIMSRFNLPIGYGKDGEIRITKDGTLYFNKID